MTDEQITALYQYLEEKFDAINERFERVERTMAYHTNEFKVHDRRLIKLEQAAPQL